MNTSALAGGQPVSLTDNGAGTQDGLASDNLSGTVTVSGTSYNLQVKDIGFSAAALNYSTFGFWQLSPSSSSTNNPVEVGWYAVGSKTGSTNVPSTGSANYSGKTDGAVVFNAKSTAYTFSGNAALAANFGTGTITGSLTGLNAYSVGNSSGQTNVGTLNDINLTSGTISGDAFSGNAAAAATSGSAANLSGLSGSFRGNFFGPSAQEAGGTLYMTSGSGSSMVLLEGSFGTKQ